MKVAMIGFGPIESRSNGYFTRCHNMVRCLLELGHEVLVLEFSEESLKNFENTCLGNEKEKLRFVQLRGNKPKNRAYSNLFQRLSFDPFQQLTFQVFSVAELVRQTTKIKNCDVVFVEGGLIPFAFFLSKLVGKVVVLDTHCMNKRLAVGYKRQNALAYRLRTIFWDLLERFSVNLSDEIVVVSEEERKFVRNEYKSPQAKTFVIPNVIEMPEKRCSENSEHLRKRLGLEGKTVVTFIGDLMSVQNREAVHYILSELAPFFLRRKDVIFLIVGRGGDLFNCAFPNVVFTGWVESIAPFLDSSEICIAPLRIGAGTITKVLDYLAHGKIVVTTPIGVEGIVFSNAEPVIVTKMDNFPEALLQTIEKYNRFKVEGDYKAAMIDRCYSIDFAKEKMAELFQKLEKRIATSREKENVVKGQRTLWS